MSKPRPPASPSRSGLRYSYPMPSLLDQPAYSCLQAAQYAGVSYATLRGWAGPEGLIVPAVEGGFSFNNLAEAHVLKAMRQGHKLPLQRIRKALKQLAAIRKTDHPLLDQSFETDGVDLCIRDEEGITNLSQHSQKEFRDHSLYSTSSVSGVTRKAWSLSSFLSSWRIPATNRRAFQSVQPSPSASPSLPAPASPLLSSQDASTHATQSQILPRLNIRLISPSWRMPFGGRADSKQPERK